MKPLRILGIDPGFGRMGFGVIEQKAGNDWKMVEFGCHETSPKKPFNERLVEIKEVITKLIDKHQPQRLAIEELFFFKNVKTAMDVGQARGVILVTAAEKELKIDEFTPLEVKQAMTGYGRAEKGQMQRIVGTILGIKDKIKSDDAADALAVALCAGQCLWLNTLNEEKR